MAHARVRWFAGEKATVEAVWVPLFTRGRYDVLDEASSPFNLLADAGRCPPSPACPPVAQFIRHEPQWLSLEQERTAEHGWFKALLHSEPVDDFVIAELAHEHDRGRVAVARRQPTSTVTQAHELFT